MLLEQKTAEYEVGKSLIDMKGRRVRMEQYLSHPAENQIKVEVYNSREDRIDTAESLDTYNTALPEDLADLVTQPEEGVPTWYVTESRVHLENDAGDTADYLLTGGAPYKIAETDNGGLYEVLYEEEELSINGIDKIDILREGHNPQENVVGYEVFYFPNQEGEREKCFDSRFELFDLSTWKYVYNAEIFPEIEVSPTLEELLKKIEAGEPIDFHGKVKLTFADDTFLGYEEACINDDGEILGTDDLEADIQRIIEGADWRDVVSGGDHEHIIAATEYEGRDIDIVWSPMSFLAEIFREDEVPTDPE